MSKLNAKINTVVNASFSQLKELIAFGDDNAWTTFTLRTGTIRVLKATAAPDVFDVSVTCIVRGNEVSVTFITSHFSLKHSDVHHMEIREEFREIAEKYKSRYGITDVEIK